MTVTGPYEDERKPSLPFTVTIRYGRVGSARAKLEREDREVVHDVPQARAVTAAGLEDVTDAHGKIVEHGPDVPHA
jgi:hypothetical protein